MSRTDGDIELSALGGSSVGSLFWDADAVSFLDEIKINGRPAIGQLESLGRLSVQEVKHPSKTATGGKIGAALVGWISIEAFLKTAERATQNKSLPVSILAISGTMITNGILNTYFNLDAVRSLRFLRDPITRQLSIPKLTLAIGVLVSFASSFAFAFLDFNDPDRTFMEHTPWEYVKFFLQIGNYSAQHYYALVAAINMIHELKCCARATPEALELHAKTMEALESAHSELSNLFFKDKIRINKFYKAENLDEHFSDGKVIEHRHNREISAKGLMNFVIEDQQRRKGSGIQQVSCKDCYSIIRSIIKGLIQIIGLGVQVVGNFGYGYSTFEGYFSLGIFSFGLSVALTSSSMAPVLLLSFILSWDNVNKIGSMIAKVITAIRQRKLDILIDEIPLSIKKAPWFSFLSGALLTVLGGASFFAALQLELEAIYGDSDHSAEFGFLDPQQKYLNWYAGTTIGAGIFFNCFPIPEVVAAVSTWYLQYFKGTPEDKQQLEVLSVMETWVARAKRIPPGAFVREAPEINRDRFTLTLPEADRGIPKILPPSKQRLCTQLTQSFCSFWKKCFSDSSQQESGYRLMERPLQ